MTANPVMRPGLFTKWEVGAGRSAPSAVREKFGIWLVTTHTELFGSIGVAERYNRGLRGPLFADLSNEAEPWDLSPSHPQGFVDNMLIIYPVGSLQRREIEQWRGLQPGSFDYNEIPTSSCQSFCWKARH
jgi:hypothetical protein